MNCIKSLNKSGENGDEVVLIDGNSYFSYHKYQNYMDIETVKALQQGDHKAFEDIFITYFDKVKYFLKGILRSESDAEELAQDIFVNLWINRKTVDPQKSFNTYIYTIARNTALNYLKHKLVEEAFIDNCNDLSLKEADSSDEILFAKEINILVEMTVCRMPVQRKKIYQMSRNNGCSNDDIAQKLSLSKKTVENQLSLALQEIRRVVSAMHLFFI